MDVATPISSVIPSLDGSVLAVLAGTTDPLPLAEIHRMTDRGSKAGVRRVLMRLVDTGIVWQVPGGYILNRAHVAAPAIEELSTLHGNLTERTRDTLDEWPGDIALAGLFGSASRRDGDEHSDIDVLVVSDSEGLDDLADALAQRIANWTGNQAHVVARSVDDLQRMQEAGEPMLESWIRDLVVLRGDRRILTRTG